MGFLLYTPHGYMSMDLKKVHELFAGSLHLRVLFSLYRRYEDKKTSLCAVLIATTPLQFAFSFGMIQAVAAVAVFFFIYVGDPKHLLSQTQKFNNIFL